MWKFIIRGIRDTCERGGERAITAAVENCQGNLTLVSNVKNQEQDTKNDEYRGQRDSSREKKSQVKLHGLLEAVGLSTVLLGAYASHPQCWRKHPHTISCGDQEKRRNVCRYKGLVHIVAGTASTQPLTTVSRNLSTQTAVPVDRHVVTKTEEDFPPEDALESALSNFRAMAGYVDNRLGVMCADKGWHREALRYFEHAWVLGDVCACYNLALCHELGVGTLKDQNRAVKYYEKATGLGHGAAMYNLGVYYAQGRGGLPVDPLKARQLFENAATQGIAEAKAALALHEPSNSIFKTSTGKEMDCHFSWGLRVPTIL